MWSCQATRWIGNPCGPINGHLFLVYGWSCHPKVDLFRAPLPWCRSVTCTCPTWGNGFAAAVLWPICWKRTSVVAVGVPWPNATKWQRWWRWRWMLLWNWFWNMFRFGCCGDAIFTDSWHCFTWTWVCLQPARHVTCCATAQRGGTKATGSRTKGWEGSWEDLKGFRECFFSIWWLKAFEVLSNNLWNRNSPNFCQQMASKNCGVASFFNRQERAERGQLTKSDVKFAFREGRKMLPPLRGYEVGLKGLMCHGGGVFLVVCGGFFPPICCSKIAWNMGLKEPRNSGAWASLPRFLEKIFGEPIIEYGMLRYVDIYLVSHISCCDCRKPQEMPKKYRDASTDEVGGAGIWCHKPWKSWNCKGETCDPWSRDRETPLHFRIHFHVHFWNLFEL